MARIFVGQDWTLELDTSIDLSTSTVQRIYFQKPNGDKSYKAASVVTPERKTIPCGLQTSLMGSEMDEDGRWVFQGYVLMADGKQYWGEVVEVEVSLNLT